MKRLALFAAIALTVIARPHAAAAAPNACTLVSTADAAKVLLAPVTKTDPSTLPDGVSCSFRSARFSSLVVTIEPFSSNSEAANTYHATITNSMVQTPPVTALPGIGDKAQRLGTMIYVLKKNTVYAFTFVGPTPTVRPRCARSRSRGQPPRISSRLRK
jgi:hypothetical protein